MKSLILTTFFLTLGAQACPDISGEYNCYEWGRDLRIEQSINAKGKTIYKITDLHLNKISEINPDGKDRVVGREKDIVWVNSASCQGNKLVVEKSVSFRGGENFTIDSYSKSGQDLKFNATFSLDGREATDKYHCTLKH